MKSVIKLLSIGLVIGLVINYYLVWTLGVKMSDSNGTEIQGFLGIAVLKATKTVLTSGGSVSTMERLPGLLVPLVGPALILLAAHLLVRYSKNHKAA